MDKRVISLFALNCYQNNWLKENARKDKMSFNILFSY